MDRQRASFQVVHWIDFLYKKTDRRIQELISLGRIANAQSTDVAMTTLHHNYFWKTWRINKLDVDSSRRAPP